MMTEHEDERDQLVEEVAATIAADGYLLGLARACAPGPVARLGLAWKEGLASLRESFRRAPQLWARRRTPTLLRTVGGGGLMAGSGVVVHEYVVGPIAVAAGPVPHVLATAVSGSGICGGVVLAATGVVACLVPMKWRVGRRDTVWEDIVEQAAIRAMERIPTPTVTATATVSAADVRHALDDLLAEWAVYRLDVEAWYLTKPLLRDVTGTVETTVAYETALQDLVAAADNLHDTSTNSEVMEASAIADRAWAAWHEANDYASRVGLGDRTPTERAALQRLSKLVTRLTRSTAGDPELAAIKRDIQACLDKVTTVSVGWGDIATLPAIERGGVLPQLGSTA